MIPGCMACSDVCHIAELREYEGQVSGGPEAVLWNGRSGRGGSPVFRGCLKVKGRLASSSQEGNQEDNRGREPR